MVYFRPGVNRFSYARTASRSSAAMKSVVPVTSKQAEKNLAKRVMQLSRLVKVRKPEVKGFDLNFGTSSVSVSTGQVVHLTAIPQGLTSISRVGDAIRVTGIDFQFIPNLDPGSVSSTGNVQAIRYCIVQNLQQQDSTDPVAGGSLVSVFDNPNPVVALKSFSGLSRFKFLYDSGTIILNWTQAGFTPDYARTHFARRRFIKCNIPVEYSNTTGASITKNGIYFVIISNCTVAAAASFDYNAVSRVFYTDI